MGFIILASRQQVSAKFGVTLVTITVCLLEVVVTGAQQHKESACRGRHAQLCGYSDSVAARSNFIPSIMSM